jgi:hypothetical protein
MVDASIIPPKLANVLAVITDSLKREKIPFGLIGAMARAVYGFPRYTSDIDLAAEGRHADRIRMILEKLGYRCFQMTRSFGQFDSEMGVLGKIDLLFLNTPEGIRMLESRATVQDDVFGEVEVIQPTDYIILKLMAIANNPDRTAGDEADILSVLKASVNGQIRAEFQGIGRDRILKLAERFRQTERTERLLKTSAGKPKAKGMFFL